ncbi:MAG: hypothetical protein J0626_08370, partial [Rhodospirillaceae bacterium]|nr:hypothetical protein [Rhodospirillaceae bacterium]
MMAEISDAHWECDLRSGALSVEFGPGRRPDWLPEPPPETLEAVAGWLEPWEWRALLREWVSWLKKAALPLEQELWLRGRPEAVRLRAVITQYDDNGAPAILTGTLGAVQGGWEAADSIPPVIRVGIESSSDALIATDPRGCLRLC